MGKLGLSILLVSSLSFAERVAPPPAAKKAPAAAASSKKPVKQMSRSELEAEVEALRAENVKMRADMEAMMAREKDRADRLQKAVGTPASTLK